MKKSSKEISYPEVIELIHNLCAKHDNFPDKVKELIETIGEWNLSKLSYHLENAGSIPEEYKHDSSEEKLYAKYCDFLIFGFFQLLGMEARLCEERGDYADVIGKTKNYIVVADAKAFRLSRTALNPKDYKIEALNGWRKKANGNFACLVAPINEFPKGKSRLYIECARYNISMLSYNHLLFIISSENFKDIDLSSLWNVSLLFKEPQKVTAKEYWKAIKEVLLKITNRTEKEWQDFENKAKLNVLETIQNQINYLTKEVEIVKNMDEEKVRELLLERLGIKNKIIQIQKKKKMLELGLPID